MIRRILFCWELGGNFGHLLNQLPLARVLRERGHHVSFAPRDILLAQQQLLPLGYQFVPAPFHTHGDISEECLVNYADILAASGFGSVARLEGLVQAWREVFARFSAEVVVAEYAPTALLAAKLEHIPVMRLDYGFSCPPPQRPFPSFRPWTGHRNEELLAKEEGLLANINALCPMWGLSPFATLQRALESDCDLLATIPELDHYPGRSFARYVGPLYNKECGFRLEWPESGEARIFVYLRPFDGLTTILKVLAERKLSVIACIPGISDQTCEQFGSRHMRIVREPVRLADLLPTADLLITHAGHGLACAGFLEGVPMLLIPQLIEQLITAQHLERLGVGQLIHSEEVGSRFAPLLGQLLSNDHYKDTAGFLARKYDQYDPQQLLENLADTVEWVARGGAGVSLESTGRYRLAHLPVNEL